MEKDQLNEMLRMDRQDLMAVLDMRFGTIPDEVRNEIEAIQKMETLERLILAAANVPDLKGFVSELKEGRGAFKLTGHLYDPLSSEQRKGQS
ncbi:MAG TPA: hypothetical protein VFK33_13125 [Bacillales bacterium]|nr:hypothetical protein [Bacillales bacterium]